MARAAMSTIRIRFADDAHEDRDPQSLVSEWPEGQQLTLDECRRSPARLDVWVQRGDEWKAVKVETAREQGWREMYEAEKARADAAEKRLADLRAWAEGKAAACEAELPSFADPYRQIIAQIDMKP